MSIKESQYHSKASAKYLLKIHLILVCKYRKQLLIEAGDECKQIMFEISQTSNFVIDTMEVDRDHIHLLLDIEPKISVNSIVNRLKSISTNRPWKRHKDFLKNHFWREKTFWSDGYFVCSTGNANMETIKKYIETQG
jgi:putative transposase